MRLKGLFLLFFLLLMSNLVLAQQPAWFSKMKNVELLKATCEDIIKLFGELGESSSQYFPYYKLNEGEISVEYSRGLCGTDNKVGWNVPEFTVTRIFFTSTKSIKPKKLGIDLTGFRKYESSDVPNFFIYENEEIGIDFDVKSNGEIEAIVFYPPSKYDSLRCKD